MIGSLIAGATLFGLPGDFDKAEITTVPFTFESRTNPNSQIVGTQKSVFVVEWPSVVAIDAGSGKRLWEKSLSSHAAVAWRGFNQNDYWRLGAFPVEAGGSVAFCFTYSKPDGAIETEVESRGRNDGALNFIVHVETRPIARSIGYSPDMKTFELDEKERSFDFMIRPNVVGVGNLLLVVPDPQLNPELFVLSAATGAVKAKIRPRTETPIPLVGPLGESNPISFGPCVYARRALITLADSSFGSPSTVVFFGNRILAEYRDDNYYRALRLKEHQGVAFFPWSPILHGKVEDVWHGAFMRMGPPKDKQPRFGPCLGQQGGNPVVLCTDWNGNTTLVEIDEKRDITRTASVDTDAIWKVVPGDSGVFLLYGRASIDLYDLNGTKLLSLRTKHQIATETDTVYENAALLPCGVTWMNYSRIKNSDKWKFVGAVVSPRNHRAK